MSFTRPTLAALISDTEADFDSRLPGADARMPASNLNVAARVMAGGLHGVYGYLDRLAKQVIYDTAEAEYLERWASIWAIYRKAASVAVGTVTFTGNAGTVIPAGTVVKRADDREYATVADVTIAAGSASAEVTAALPGAAGNLGVNGKLQMISPIAGVVSTALVAAGGLTGGADVEADAALLARLLARIRQAPHGGAQHDYVAWALEVPGVTRAWVFPSWLGIGTVGVAFVCDGNETIIPNAEKVAEVQAYIDARRPVTAEAIVFAPAPVALDLTIAGLDPATDAVKAAIRAELVDLLEREAEPGATILISHVREAISLALGEADHTLTAPAANIPHAANEIAVLGAFTWA